MVARPRGHTSLTGAADAQIAIKRDDARTITATVEWMKDGPEGDEIFSRLTALCEPADVVGYSRMVGADEEGTIKRVTAFRTDLLDPSLARHDGRIVKTMGDGFLIE